jgi:predicted DsbA family dithiol-disulfide isomerase
VRDEQELAMTHELAVSAAQQGIQGVPFFVFDNKFALSGAQPQEVFERAFEYALDPEKLKEATA